MSLDLEKYGRLALKIRDYDACSDDDVDAAADAIVALVAHVNAGLAALELARPLVAAWPQCRDKELPVIDAAIASMRGEAAPCPHPHQVEQHTGDGTPVMFCPDCGRNEVEQSCRQFEADEQRRTEWHDEMRADAFGEKGGA